MERSGRIFSRFFGLLVLLTAFLAASAAWAEVLPRVDPERVGLSTKRLDRLDRHLAEEVKQGRIPGAVALIAREGKIAYYKSFGHLDPKTGAPMPKDAIFRIYSMTKPLVSVGAMILSEEGRLLLSDPVAKYLPEFGKMEVGTETRDEAGQRVVTTAPAQRQMTVQDLLRHTSGLTYGVLGRSAIKSMYRKAGVYSTQQTMAERVARLAKMPLICEPGARWEYSHSTDVLGRVIEVVSGESLDEFLADRLFGPLAMKDTGFWVKPDSQGRLAQAGKDSKTGRSVELLNVTSRPALLSGGGGGVSTAEDYLIFCQMLLSGGWINGVRVLSPKTVDYMTADHLGTIPGFSPGNGFGLGFGVRTAAGVSAVPGSVGTYYWGGWAGTVFWVDPEEEMIAILMVQAPAESDRLNTLFYALVYQALVD